MINWWNELTDNDAQVKTSRHGHSEHIITERYPNQSAVTACLNVLLDLTHYTGSDRHLHDALPHAEQQLSIAGILTTMRNLHYSHDEQVLKNINSLEDTELPCLWLTDNDTWIIDKIDNNQVHYFSGNDNKWNAQSVKDIMHQHGVGTLHFFKKLKKLPPLTISSMYQHIFADHKKLVVELFVITFIVNLGYLAIPFFIKSVYDTVIPSESLSVLAQLAAGVFIVLTLIYLLEKMRKGVLVLIGNSLEDNISNQLFKKLLNLSASYSDNTPIAAQVTRLKDFENAAGFLLGPMINILLELPYVFLFIGVVTIIAGNLAIIPLISIAVLIITAFIIWPIVKKIRLETTEANSERQEFMLEALNNMTMLHQLNLESPWRRRFKKINEDAQKANYKMTVMSGIIDIIADATMIIAAIAILGLGILQIFENAITVGTLIAIMILLWRILGPIKLAFASFPRMIQAHNSLQQVKAFLNLNQEREPTDFSEVLQKFKGNVAFNRVSMRYGVDSNPSLVGVDFEIKSGEFLAVVGENGSGKTSIFKILLGLYKPQLGSVTLDDIDIRQIKPTHLRHNIAYVPQDNLFFYGTIKQNLSLASPNIANQEMLKIIKLVGLEKEIKDLPEGLDTRLTDHWQAQYPVSFLHRLSLARACLMNPAILLIDQQIARLDSKTLHAYQCVINEYKHKVTILMNCYQDTFLHHADKILVLNKGHVVKFGDAKEFNVK